MEYYQIISGGKMRLKLKDLKSLREVLNCAIEKMEKNAEAQKRFKAKKNLAREKKS